MSATRGATDALSGVSRHVNDTVSQTPSSYIFTAKFGVVKWQLRLLIKYFLSSLLI